MDDVKNFAEFDVSTGYDNAATSIVLASGGGARMPAPPFNAVWWNKTDYANPADDPNREIIRVTAISTDTLTVTRGQEGIAASNKNTGGKTYRIAAVTSALWLHALNSFAGAMSGEFKKNKHWKAILFASGSTTPTLLNMSSLNQQSPGAGVVSATYTRHLNYTTTSGVFGILENADDFHSSWDWEWVWYVRFEGTVANMRFWAAFKAAAVHTSDTPANTFGFRYSTGASDTNFQCYTHDGSSSLTDSGVAVAVDTNYLLCIRKIGTEVKFYINGTLVATKTFNPSATSMAHNCIGNILSGTASHTLRVFEAQGPVTLQ